VNEDRGWEVQFGVDEAQRGREEKEGSGIGSRGRGGVLGAGDVDGWGPNDRAADAPPIALPRGGSAPAPHHRRQQQPRDNNQTAHGREREEEDGTAATGGGA